MYRIHGLKESLHGSTSVGSLMKINDIISPKLCHHHDTRSSTTMQHLQILPYSSTNEETFKTLQGLVNSVLNSMKFNKVGKQRNIPFLSGGWTVTDCHSYYHRFDMLDNRMPNLISSAHFTPSELHSIGKVIIQTIQHLVKTSNTSFPDSDSLKAKAIHKYRMTFAKSLGLDITSSEVQQYFRVDGFSFVLNTFVQYHNDNLNANNEFDQTYSISIPVSIETIAPSAKKKILEYKLPSKYGYIRLSLMLYSRDCIEQIVDIELRMNQSLACTTRSNPIIPKMLTTLFNASDDRNYNNFFNDTYNNIPNVSEYCDDYSGQLLHSKFTARTAMYQKDVSNESIELKSSESSVIPKINLGHICKGVFVNRLSSLFLDTSKFEENDML